MISLTDESKITKTYPMENLSNKKVLSECSQYLGHGVCFNSANKENCHSSNRSSNVQKENIPINAFTFSLNNSGSPSPVDKPTSLGSVNCITPNKDERETNANCEMNNQAISSIDFSALTAADFGISPVSFTKYKGMAMSRLKKLRRQSTIGVRGSPENNALIRYIAHQKRSRTEDPPLQASPFQRNALLKDKIAAFQSSFKPLDEVKEEMTHMPYNSKQSGTRSHKQSQQDQVRSSECKTIALEDALNCKSTNGEKTSADIQTVAVLQPNTMESEHVPLEAAPVAVISETACGIPSQTTNEELSSDLMSQQSCKKVRFAEKQSLEIFDETKPPITPLQKGHFPSIYPSNGCLRSVLKKTPVRMLVEDLTEHLDYTSMQKGSEELPVFQSCGPLQTERSTKPIDKMEVHSKELVLEVFDALQPVDTPIRSEASFSPSESRNDSSFSITPMEKPLSQPNFDGDDDLLQELSEVVSTAQTVVNSSYLEVTEIKKSSDLQTTCIRVTRSSAKKVSKIEETSVGLRSETRPKRTCNTNKVPNSKKFQKGNMVTKSAPKKTPASRHKAFGKRKREKKMQKAFHGHYETVSKKTLLSPIPEMTEDVSLISSYQSAPESSVSILDCSCSSIINETHEKTNSVMHSTEEDGNHLCSNLCAVKEDALPDAVSCSSLQLQDAILNDTQIALPLEPPGSDSSRNINNTSNGQVLKSDYSSENEMELGLLNQQGTGDKNSKEASLLVDSAMKQLSGGDINMNFKRNPRRSRRITCYLPSVEDFQSETFRNNSCLPGGNTEELPCMPQAVNDSGFLNDVLNSIEESFKSVTSSTQKRVRRSMRQLKNAESEGLAWISVFDNDSAHKARRKTYTFCPQESEMLHHKQENWAQILSSITEEPKSAHVAEEPHRQRKKRKSICSQCEGENFKTASRTYRRVSLGYKTD